MSLQTIIDNATYISFDQKKIAGQSMSRSGRLLTAELASAVPYKFTVGTHEGLKYSTNRDLISSIDALDITEESTIDIGATNTGLDYITAYQGDSTGIALCSITGSSGASLILNCGSAGTGTFLFKKGDYIQPTGAYRYPYQVTADVAHTTSNPVTVPINRPFIDQDGYTVNGALFKVGRDVTWTVKMLNKPVASVVPHDRVVFNSDFELVEIIRKEDG